jgi:hypothetical protein
LSLAAKATMTALYAIMFLLVAVVLGFFAIHLAVMRLFLVLLIPLAIWGTLDVYFLWRHS